MEKILNVVEFMINIVFGKIVTSCGTYYKIDSKRLKPLGFNKISDYKKNHDVYKIPGITGTWAKATDLLKPFIDFKVLTDTERELLKAYQLNTNTLKKKDKIALIKLLVDVDVKQKAGIDIYMDVISDNAFIIDQLLEYDSNNEKLKAKKANIVTSTEDKLNAVNELLIANDYYATVTKFKEYGISHLLSTTEKEDEQLFLDFFNDFSNKRSLSEESKYIALLLFRDFFTMKYTEGVYNEVFNTYDLDEVDYDEELEMELAVKSLYIYYNEIVNNKLLNDFIERNTKTLINKNIKLRLKKDMLKNQ